MNSQKDEKMQHDNTEKITSPKREIEGVVTGEPPAERISKVTSAPAPTAIDNQCKVGAVENSAVDRPTEETKSQPLEPDSDISAPPGHRSALDSVSNVENMTQLIPELTQQMHASTSQGLNDQKPALPADHQPTIEGQKSADQVVQKNENAEHKQSNEIRGSEGEHVLDKLQNVALNKAQEIPKVESEESAKMSVESGKPLESSVTPEIDEAIEKSASEKTDRKDAINNSLCDPKAEVFA
ncbi:unnamed protein product [Anisakis simplex]|uniref:Uncharacterized protein n=1 Tax=Anisakis simplex TaxID=6269 RepID=A0A3P6NQZ7_ANISI|nr:unnamed protein product [Anisakis simplex]